MADFGPFIKITVLALKEAGYDAEVKFLPWLRCLNEGKKGIFDMIVGVWWLNTERESWTAYTDGILENEVGLYKRKYDKLVFKNYADLKEKNVVVGTVHGYINPESFVQTGIKTEQVTKDLQNMEKLLANRIRLVLVDKNLGAYLLKKQGEENEIEWLVTLQKIPLRNGIMKNAKGDWVKKLDDFNNGLWILKEQGVVEKILKEYDIQF
ncbi:substrate-binding periplasmic protein [Desulfosediminicola flagellatus]|uniref:substrate-binding periplasmic protein n=1 Tax=Desulfosediminicola flagellatus TaxID=2569541 RepID=UPI00142E988A|nr:transporter substrate-binding domain-containing protein [Desulfosediminicola flagellatus]